MKMIPKTVKLSTLRSGQEFYHNGDKFQFSSLDSGKFIVEKPKVGSYHPQIKEYKEDVDVTIFTF